MSSQIWTTAAAIARYQRAHDTYSLVLSTHNSQHHGSPSSYSSAHTIDTFTAVTLDTGLPSFACPGGGCSTRWTMPSDAREAHYARCGRGADEPYDKWLAGCSQVYYTCNTSENARHKPVDCSLNKWLETTHGWSETACPGDHRRCMPGRITRPHSTIIRGVNVTSTCGGSRPSPPPSAGNPPSENPVVSPPPTPTPTPPPSPTYHACGEHETSVSGDHSLQASCSSTDSNGNYCTVTNFYACASHTHSYPAPPPPPTTVSCARAACGEQVSDRLKHRVDNCSNCNAVYWTCYPDAIYDHETTFTCRRSGCGATFTRCSNTPTSCQSENYHWAQD
ncbi:MAG: hypothetical protein OXL96_03550 [Candidatus Poribacteria bacterium]|nr:hypothetical protein [Candidatus Poribacteria bacterium]